jgi:hypothetical protein
LNNQDEFVKHVYFVTRDMYTVIKNAETFQTGNMLNFKGLPSDKPPRYDKIILAAK